MYVNVMKRRTLLLGLGTTAAGSAVLFGSGAFTQVSADRGVTIGIDRDSEALLALIANDEFDSVFESDDGELTIDTDELSDGNEGFNVGATIEIGETDGDEVVDGEEAFKIVNNFDSNVNVTIDLTDEDFGDGSGDLTFYTTRSDNELNESVTADEEDGELALETVESGAEVLVAIEIETDSTSDPDDFDGEVTFTAEPSAQASAPEPDGSISIGDETYGTLDEAVDAAEDGDTIVLGPSNSSYTLSETIEIDNLTIEGPNAGVSGDGSRGTEATIDSQVVISGDGVTLDGVEVTPPPATEDQEAEAIRVDNTPNGVTIKNNVVRDFEEDGLDQWEGVDGINVFGGDEDEAIENIDIENNVVEKVQGRDEDGGVAGISVQGNVENATVTGNTVSDITQEHSPWGFGIVIRDTGNHNESPQNIEISANDISAVLSDTDSDTFGVGIGVEADGADYTITGNDIENVGLGFEFKEATGETELSDNRFRDAEVLLDDQDGDADLDAILDNNDFAEAAAVDDVDDGPSDASEQAIFPEIQEAVDAAATDVTVTVAPGTYEESIEIDVEGLIVEGPNAGIAGDSEGRGDAALISVDMGEAPQGRGLIIDGDQVTVDGIDVESQGAETNQETAIYVRGDDATVTSTLVSDADIAFGVEAEGSAADELEVSGSYFEGVRNGVYVNPAEGVDIKSNTFENNGNTGIGLAGVSNVEVESNEFTNGDELAVEAFALGENVTVNGNNIFEGGISDDGDGEGLDATDNWWDTDDPDEIEDLVEGDVEFEPFAVEPFDLD